MPCSATRPGAGAGTAIPDDAEASRARSAAMRDIRYMTDALGVRADLVGMAFMRVPVNARLAGELCVLLEVCPSRMAHQLCGMAGLRLGGVGPT